MSDPLSVFAPMVTELPVAGTAGLRVETWHPVNAWVVMAYRGADGATGNALSAFAASNADAMILNTGPGTWLILGNPKASTLPDLDEVAVTFDQGDGYALLRLHGSVAATVLQKGIFVDLEKALADAGSSVSSVIAHINVTVWRASADVISVAVPRSFAGSFWHWLIAAAAGEGQSIGR